MSGLQVANSLGGFYRMFKKLSSEMKFPLNSNFAAAFHSLNKEGNVYEEYYLLGWDAMPCSLLEVYWRFGETYLPQICNQKVEFCFQVACLDCSLTLKMEALRSSETSIDFHRTTFFMVTTSRSPKSRLSSLYMYISRADLYLL
jgi:hypothetical protein